MRSKDKSTNESFQENENKKRPTNKGKGRSRNSKSRDRKEDRAPQSLDKAGKDNDPNWYFDSKDLAEEVCHLSFNSFIGEGKVAGTQYKLPSIVRLPVNPSPFNSYDIENGSSFTLIQRSGLNLTITQLYTLLASYSGRAANYAPQDVGAIILAMGEIVSCIEDLRRVVGVTYSFSERNRALPKLLIHALGYDYDDFIRNRAIYIDRLNAIITRFNSLPILGNIAYILKCRDIFQKVYADSMSAESTLIVMVPHSTWTLDESSYSGGTIMKTTQWTPTTGYDTFKNHLDTLNNMVEALFGSTTLNMIYADLLNLASKVKVDMFKIDYVTGDYIVLPEYNENFLMQVHNADIIGDPDGDTFGLQYGMQVTPSNDVYPDPSSNGLIYNPIWKYGLVTGQTTHYMSLVDLPDANPSVENIIEATRYKCISTAAWPADDVTLMSVVPDHYIVAWVVWTSDDAAELGKSPESNWYTGDTMPSYGEMMAALSQVDWAPLFFYQNVGAFGNPPYWIHGDLNFYTQISPQTLLAMNRIIAQDLFKFRM